MPVEVGYRVETRVWRVGARAFSCFSRSTIPEQKEELLVVYCVSFPPDYDVIC